MRRDRASAPADVITCARLCHPSPSRPIRATLPSEPEPQRRNHETADDPERSQPQSAGRARASHLRHHHAGAGRESCEQHARQLGLELAFHQSNHEGELVDWIQSARQSADAIVINPAAYSFTSIAIIDAIKAFEGRVVEVHISNIHARDELPRHSKISSAVTAVIAGLGPYGYVAAMHALAQMKPKA